MRLHFVLDAISSTLASETHMLMTTLAGTSNGALEGGRRCWRTSHLPRRLIASCASTARTPRSRAVRAVLRVRSESSSQGLQWHPHCASHLRCRRHAAVLKAKNCAGAVFSASDLAGRPAGRALLARGLLDRKRLTR